jgi:hypothetical protein
LKARSVRNGALVGAALSLALHLGVGLYVGGHEAPPLAFEFELPVDVEFGISDEMMLAASESEPASADEQEVETVENADGEGVGDAGVVDAGPDAGPDTGPPDAGPPDAGPEDAEVDAASDAGNADGDGGTSRIPPGAQLAIRMDMELIRASRLAPQVRGLLEAIPDWRLILEGSGIEPTTDLDRLLIATPNLQRSRLVMAGRHSHPEEGRAFMDRTIEQMAATRGVQVRWRREEGVDVADWPNEDTTARVVAIVGPRHFTITRPEDLVRILGIAQVRAEREAEEESEGDEPTGPSGEGADALLSMGEGEAFTLEAEGVQNFVRSARADVAHLPERIRVGLADNGQGVSVRGVAHYPSEETAAAAAEFWAAERDRQMDAMPGFVRMLVPRVTIEADGDEVRINSDASYVAAIAGIGRITGMLTTRRRGPRTSMGTSMAGTMVTDMAATEDAPPVPPETEAASPSMGGVLGE